MKEVPGLPQRSQKPEREAVQQREASKRIAKRAANTVESPEENKKLASAAASSRGATRDSLEQQLKSVFRHKNQERLQECAFAQEQRERLPEADNKKGTALEQETP